MVDDSKGFEQRGIRRGGYHDYSADCDYSKALITEESVEVLHIRSSGEGNII